jgi:HEAT repeat protein
VVASSALGDPLALTDGRVDTSWAEGRGGEGRGEFVVLRPLSGVSLISLELLVRAEGEAAVTGTAPRSVWLVTRSSVRRIDWAENAWQTPGVWYRVQLPAPLQEDCLALVLEQAYADTPETQVTLAELRGVSELQSLEPAQLVARLSTPGDAGSAAVPALLQAGPAGVDAVVNAFSALDAVGRARALDVLEGAPCESAARVYVDVLGDDDARVRRRAEQRLIACGDAASPELRRAFAQSSAEGGVDLARSITAISPALAVELIGARLAAVARQHRAEYRDVLSRAARHVDAEPELRRLLGTGGLGVAAEVDVLRALGDELPRFQPEASLTLARATSAARSFAQRFLLLAPAAHLAPKDAGAASFVQLALTDPDPYLRQTAARAAPDVPPLRAALIAATRDEEVRVREASSVRLGELGLTLAAPALTERLSADRWPMVRGAAARSLASVGPSAPVDAALGKASLDAVDTVRSLALWSLGQRGARAQLPVVVGRFQDDKELASVRAAAVRALAEMCDLSQLGPLTQAVARLGTERPSADDVVIGAAAAAALGRLSPPDLERRLAPLARAKAHPALEQILSSARQPAKRCAASPLSANPPRR